ncbi:extracellular solute-binding protein [Tessaracoccus lubricantis]|uniref:Extracellular solute-binding protein n=1 Tax=Tessaracoccus lubricantis TaxID=545543 RepID=A0ABP9FN27_9ACTN
MKKALIGTAIAALLLSACGGGATEPGETTAPSDAASSAAGGEPVTLSFWHNSTTGPGKAYWEDTTAAFTAENPNVTFEIQVIQNEDMDGRLQTALNSGDAPDIFMARGGGKLADMVEAQQIMDITDAISDETKEAYGDAIVNTFNVDGKIYGLPTSLLPGGIYYSKDLFEAAGIEGTPENMDELNDAVAKLKESGVEPIALGGKDAWPAAHWYYFFVLRQCSEDTINKAADLDFSDQCWLEAGKQLKEFADTEPFNQGFLTTSAQQGAGSSAGLVANHLAGMELMGAWNPGVIASLTPDEKPLPDLGWFPFPAVEGGEGDPTAMMGGADGYACYIDSPAECADFLNFYASKANQEAYATAFNTLPANGDAADAVEDPALKDILGAYSNAAYMTVWLDTLLGQNVGNALNAGVVNMLAGQGTPEDIVSAVESAAAKG